MYGLDTTTVLGRWNFKDSQGSFGAPVFADFDGNGYNDCVRGAIQQAYVYNVEGRLLSTVTMRATDDGLLLSDVCGPMFRRAVRRGEGIPANVLHR